MSAGQDEVTLAPSEGAVNLVHSEGKDDLGGGMAGKDEHGKVVRLGDVLSIEGRVFFVLVLLFCIVVRVQIT